MKYATQPSPLFPTKVVPLASPAILNTDPPIRSNARCDPANNETICPPLKKLADIWGVSRLARRD